MNLRIEFASAVLSLGALLANPVNAEEPAFDQEVLEACVVDGAADWRARMDELTPVEQEIMDLERSGCHDLAAQKVDDLVERIIAEHGIILLDGAGIVDGKEAQRELFKTFLGEGYKLAYEPVDAKVSSSEDMAWAIGMVRVTAPDGSVEYSKYTSIWQKIGDEWKNVVEMRNSNGKLGSTLF